MHCNYGGQAEFQLSDILRPKFNKKFTQIFISSGSKIVGFKSCEHTEIRDLAEKLVNQD